MGHEGTSYCEFDLGSARNAVAVLERNAVNGDVYSFAPIVMQRWEKKTRGGVIQKKENRRDVYRSVPDLKYMNALCQYNSSV